MSGARVETRIGKSPIILVAPHGPDDVNTDVIVEVAARHLDSYAVINKGFERSSVVIESEDQADCNKVDHASADVVYDEFLKPIIKFKNFIKKKISPGFGWSLPGPTDKKALILHIHGVGNKIHKDTGETVGCVIGYGLGIKRDSLTCEIWRKNLFVDLWRNLRKTEIFEGSGGSNYAGRSSNNMNQYFRKHELDPWVDSMQIEIPYSDRKSDFGAAMTGRELSEVIQGMVDIDTYTLEPVPKFI